MSMCRRGAAAAALVALLPLSIASQQVELLPGSAVVLRGRTNVSAWSCAVTTIDVRGGERLDDALVRLEVTDVSCGSERMEGDLRRALRAREHPAIVMRDLQLVENERDVAIVSGTLEVAGVARPVTARVRWQASGGRLELRGTLPLRMTDFGVEPPRALLGMVRARDEVVVEYDVTLAVDATLLAAGRQLAGATATGGAP